MSEDTLIPLGLFAMVVAIAWLRAQTTRSRLDAPRGGGGEPATGRDLRNPLGPGGHRYRRAARSLRPRGLMSGFGSLPGGAPGLGQGSRGSDRIWKWSTLLVVPLPVSMWKGARVLTVAQTPLPFHPAAGSSIRPSTHFV